MVLPLIAKHSSLSTLIPTCIPRSKHARCFTSSPLSSSPHHRPYRFHVGASWAEKPSDPRDPRVRTEPFPADSPIGQWRDATLSRPNPAAGRHIGEDFFYIQDMRDSSGISLGVADGVGGWAESGIDASLYSQALMYHAHRYAKVAWPGEPEIDPLQEYEDREQVEGWEISPVECLELAYGGVLRERHVEAGSSTACILTLNASNGMLRAANLGDSGFLVIRASQVVHQQRPQTYSFNCPKQLSKLPTVRGLFSRADRIVDHPRDADVCELKLRHGDLIISYTDGLSDNVFPSEMVAICGLVARQSQLNTRTITPVGEVEFEGNVEDREAQLMAERIVDYARICMANRKRSSPFSRAASRAGMYYMGGKPDDVTVLVTMVQEAS